MNKIIKAAALLTSAIVLMCSCSNLNEEENRKKSSVYEEYFEYQEDIGSWLKEENEYLYDRSADNSDGIIALNNTAYKPNGERLYFNLSRQTQTSAGDDLWVYVDINTGEKYYVCPDSSCGHDYESKCPYVDLTQLTFPAESETVAYAVRMDYKEATGRNNIYEIDFSENTINKVYDAFDIHSKSEIDNIELFFVNENFLYFKDVYTQSDMNDDEFAPEEKIYLVELNLWTGNTQIISEDFDPNDEFIYRSRDHIYFMNQTERRIFCTDLDFQNETELITYKSGYEIYDMYYDTDLNEFYVLISNAELHHPLNLVKNFLSQKCVVYCIDEDLRCSELSMPTEHILNFQLTNEYIYYTTYDPINYETFGELVDCAGNKIYRIERNGNGEGELVFDGHDEIFFMNGFYVTGDYLYINYSELRDYGNQMWFVERGSSIRIDMERDTILWLNLD